MLIQRIKVSNYKTYLDLDLDLTVDEERPIFLSEALTVAVRPLCLRLSAVPSMASKSRTVTTSWSL